MTDDITDGLEVMSAIGGMTHLSHGYMFRIVHLHVGRVHHRQSVSPAHLRQVDLLAEQEDGVVDRAATLQIVPGQDDERPVTGIDGAGLMVLVSLTSIKGVPVERVEEGEAVDGPEDPEGVQRQPVHPSRVTVSVFIAGVDLRSDPSCIPSAVVVGQLREEVLFHGQIHVAHDDIIVVLHLHLSHQSSHGPEVAGVVLVGVPAHEDVEPDLVAGILLRSPEK